MGGINDSGLALRSVDCYNPVLNTWHHLADMLEARTDFGVAVVDDQIYVVGGNSFDGKSMSTVEKYIVEKVS